MGLSSFVNAGLKAACRRRDPEFFAAVAFRYGEVPKLSEVGTSLRSREAYPFSELHALGKIRGREVAHQASSLQVLKPGRKVF